MIFLAFFSLRWIFRSACYRSNSGQTLDGRTHLFRELFLISNHMDLFQLRWWSSSKSMGSMFAIQVLYHQHRNVQCLSPCGNWPSVLLQISNTFSAHVVIVCTRERRVPRIVARFIVAWWKLAGRAQLRTSLVDREVFWTVIAGSRLLAEPAWRSRDVKRRRRTGGTSSRGAPMPTTMKHVVTQLQQQLFSLRAQVTAQSGLADAVRAINNLAAAQVWKNTPSLIDVNGLGRPRELSGKEEDFQQWSKKTTDFFAGDLGVRDDVVVCSWTADGNHDDSN